MVRSAAGKRARRGFLLSAIAFLIPVLAVVIAAIDTRQGRVIIVAVQRFLLFYSGVFALVALTAAIGAGLLAAGKIALSPRHRVAAQAVHRAVSLVAVATLATHIVLEMVARRARTADAFVPFLTRGRTFYMGLGTIASDLVILVIATGIVRRRFAAGRVPWAWRVLHVTAYLAWPFAILHGLLAGRHAKPYVDWSYAACLAVAGLVLVIRYVATVRGRDTAAQPVPDRASWPAGAAGPALPPGPAAPAVAARRAGPAVVSGLAGGLAGELVSQRSPHRAALPGERRPGFWLPGDEQP
jgi:hypothetical protein